MDQSQQQNYYEILGVKPDATFLVIRDTYRTLTKRYHPDRNPDDNNALEIFKKINDANDTLKDRKLRAEYDAYLKLGDTKRDFSLLKANTGYYQDLLNSNIVQEQRAAQPHTNPPRNKPSPAPKPNAEPRNSTQNDQDTLLKLVEKNQRKNQIQIITPGESAEWLKNLPMGHRNMEQVITRRIRK